MKWSPAIRINLASNILGDFNEDILECFIDGKATDVAQKVRDYSRMSAFTQRAYRTSIILAAGVMREQLENYYSVVTFLIGSDMCRGFMTPEKLNSLLDSIVNSDYGQFQLAYVPTYYDRWPKKSSLSPEKMKNLKRWFMRLSKIRRNFQERGYIAYPDWLQVRW
jgi:hypothetical protein